MTRILVVDDSPTIRRVVSTILEKCGYDPKVASDGQDAYEALASGEVKADLVLLDFVMPHMNGYEFCRALRENVDLASTPIVLMSARADHIRDQFVEQTGAIDAISKPFDREALVAVIDHALRKVKNTHANRANRISSARIIAEAPSTSDVGRGTVVAPAEATSKTRIVAQRLAAIAAGVLAHHPSGSDTGDLVAKLAERFAHEAMPELAELVGDLDRVDRARALLSGDLGVVPIGAILQLLQAENQTGILVCTSPASSLIRAGDGESAEIRATFREGVIDLVQSTGAGDEFRLGRFFVEAGMVTAEEIELITERQHALPELAPDSSLGDTQAGTAWGHEASVSTSTSTSTAPPKPLGMALLAAGRIVESQLRSALSRQSSELLYEVIRWPAGRFELRRVPPGELAVSARLGLPVASVVMEGFRRVDEWRAIERALGSFDAVVFRDDAAFGTLEVGSLPPKERAVLDVVDGVRSVRAVVAASHLSSFDACRILAQFLEARVLRRRDPVSEMLRGAVGGVMFDVGDELYFLPASIAVKLMPAPRVARMPGAPAELRGVALIDGEMIPVVDVHVAAAPGAASPGAEGDAMLVCKVHGESVGFVGLQVVATGFFDVAPSGETRLGERVARSFDAAAIIAKVREGRWAV